MNGNGTASSDVVEAIERALVQIGWLGQRQFMQLLSEAHFDLTIPQYHTLAHLQQCVQMCTMSDLARATHQSAASLTGVVDRLLDKQMVKRVRPANGDRRQVVVAITEQGRALLTAIRHARHADLQAALATIDADQRAALLALLSALLDGMAQRIADREALRQR